MMNSILNERDLISLRKKVISLFIVSIMLFILMSSMTIAPTTEGILFDKIDNGITIAKETVLPISAKAAGNTVEVKIGDDGDIEFDGEGSDMFADYSTTAWNKIFGKYRGIINGVSGIATLTMLAAFIFNFTKLGTTSGNDKERRSTITAILFTGIATALLGSVTIVMGFFYNAFNGL
jgi:hypothetical protein